MTQRYAGGGDRTRMSYKAQGILSPSKQGERTPNNGRSVPQVGVSRGRRPVRTVYLSATGRKSTFYGEHRSSYPSVQGRPAAVSAVVAGVSAGGEQ